MSHRCTTATVRPLAITEDERILGNWAESRGRYQCAVCGQQWSIHTTIGASEYEGRFIPVVFTGRWRRVKPAPAAGEA